MKLVGCSKSFQDMVIRPRMIVECIPMNARLEKLYLHAVQEAVELIDTLEHHMNDHTPLDTRLDHTFGEF